MSICRGIYIDDAGTPGAQSKSSFLPEDRKSFCAVLVPGEVASDVSRLMEIFLTGVKQDFHADELHFTEIYSGNGPWKGVKVEDRMKVFDLMSSLLEKFSLPVFFQTSSSVSELSVLGQFRANKEIWWDFSNVSHQALFFLAHVISSKITEYAAEDEASASFREPWPAFIDEGLMKSGAEAVLPISGDVFLDRKIHFRSSKDCPGLQLADFAAFCISRAQWLAVKCDPGGALGKADLHILEASGKINCWNLLRTEIDPEKFSRDTYEWVLMKDRKAKGLGPKPQRPNLPRKRKK